MFLKTAQIIILTGSVSFLNCKEIRYNSKILQRFVKDFNGHSKNFALSKISLYSCSY